MSDFETGLFACFNDCGICCITFFCPCFTSAKNKAAVDERDCTFCDCICYPNEYFTRQQIRAKYGFEFNPLVDCLVAMFCYGCTICQHAQELRAKGYGKH
eukprot:TRINITY_DN428_c0_g2_i1.p1 TRINITY_DN428_c0_g2~~TRINITY_DN428_c0_g2_i1.p1  ORF type:complete len:117 (-),score=19.27 TRINITY_DN428_c0_g2_i1:50-349(-)